LDKGMYVMSKPFQMEKFASRIMEIIQG